MRIGSLILFACKLGCSARHGNEVIDTRSIGDGRRGSLKQVMLGGGVYGVGIMRLQSIEDDTPDTDCEENGME